jgi:hypothetical protein
LASKLWARRTSSALRMLGRWSSMAVAFGRR